MMMSPSFEQRNVSGGALDQSINQRAMNDTAAFRRQQSNGSGANHAKFTTLHSFLKEQVYGAV
jgi:hypothetical protein